MHYNICYLKPLKKLFVMQSLKIRIENLNETEMTLEFDIIGIGPPIVNALRRILIAEVCH